MARSLTRTIYHSVATILLLAAQATLPGMAVHAQTASTPPAWVSGVPQGTWAAISKNRITDVDAAKDPTLNPGGGSPPWRGNTGLRAILDAWNGGAFATGYGSHGSLLVFGGGHNDYLGSEVYAFDMATQMWKRVTNPYPGPFNWPYSTTSYPDGSPVPPHTFEFVDYHPGSNSFVLLRGIEDGVASTNATDQFRTHMLDLDTGQWRRSPRNGTLGADGGGVSCYDSNRDVFWALGPSSTTNPFTKFDPNVTNADGSVGAYTNYNALPHDIDAGAACDPVNDLFVFTAFRYSTRIYALDLKNPNGGRVALNETGDIPAKRGAGGWEWSQKRQAFIYWRQGGGVYEFKHVSGSWSTGTWRWTNLTSGSNTVVPQDMVQDNGVYSRFRLARYGNEEVAVVVNRVDGPVYAFRIPDSGTTSTAPPVTISLAASPTTVASGGTSQLSWSTVNASSCTASGGWTGSRAVSGTANVGPLAASTTFVLDCVSTAGASARASVQVNVTSTAPANSPPSISGTPSGEVAVGSTYTFQPQASDSNGDSLSFSIQNKPVWASFSTSTGRLSGTPSASHVGMTSGIVISVSDGKDTRSLASFSINVVSQGTYGGTLLWVAPTQAADGSSLDDLAGYNVYVGTASKSYSRSIKLANPGMTSYYVDGLTAGTYYFAVTGYDLDGNESTPSNEVKAILGTTGGSTGGSDGGSTGGSDGGSTGGSDGGSTGGSGGGSTGGGDGSGGGSTGGSSGGTGALGWAELLLALLAAAGRSLGRGRVPGGVAVHGAPAERFSMLRSGFACVIALALLGPGLALADDADFQRRCSGSGVLRCVGFDSPSEVVMGQTLLPAWDGSYRGTFDTQYRASGASSLRFEVPAYSAANTSGSALMDMGRGFGPGSTFYVQFRQRFNQAMLDTQFKSDGWKQVIFHRTGVSCGNVELTTQNTYNQGFPIMYTDCGSRQLKQTLGSSDFLLQQGDYQCKYSTRPNGCATYTANQWMTFSYRVQIGDWNTATSSIQAWVAYEGQPLKKWIDMSGFVLKYGASTADTYSKIQLTPYQSKKDTTQNHPTGYVWYDELIVSTAAIPGPEGDVPAGGSEPPADSTPPAPPTSLFFQQ